MKRFTPTEHESLRLKQEAQTKIDAEKRKREEDSLHRAFDAILKTDSGRLVWRWFSQRCNWTGPILMRSSTDVAPLTTECVAAQREVYRDARRLVSRELLVRAEEFAEFGEKPEEIKGGK